MYTCGNINKVEYHIPLYSVSNIRLRDPILKVLVTMDTYENQVYGLETLLLLDLVSLCSQSLFNTYSRYFGARFEEVGADRSRHVTLDAVIRAPTVHAVDTLRFVFHCNMRSSMTCTHIF